MQHGRGIEYLIVHDDRQTYDCQARKLARRSGGEAIQFLQRRPEQGGLVKQIAAGVAGQTHFGKDDDFDAVGSGALEQAKGAIGIERWIADPQSRDGGGDADETVAGHSVSGEW
jgi:hypothetical protein